MQCHQIALKALIPQHLKLLNQKKKFEVRIVRQARQRCSRLVVSWPSTVACFDVC